MTAISLERWSHYQGSDRWRRKMLHLGWCDCPSVWPIFGGSASDGEGAGGYFCLIGFNKVETIWIIGNCWILVVMPVDLLSLKLIHFTSIGGEIHWEQSLYKGLKTNTQSSNVLKSRNQKNIGVRNNLFWSAFRCASLRHNCFCQTATNRNSH